MVTVYSPMRPVDSQDPLDAAAVSLAPSPESNPNSPLPVVATVGPYPTPRKPETAAEASTVRSTGHLSDSI